MIGCFVRRKVSGHRWSSVSCVVEIGGRFFDQVVARGSCISRSNEVIWLIHLVLLDRRAGHLTRAWMVVSEVFVWLFLQERQKSSECVMGSRW